MSKSLLVYDDALKIAEELKKTLEDTCRIIRIAGSLRRKRPQVKDIELVCVPLTGQVTLPGELFSREADLLDVRVTELITRGVLRKRLNVNGQSSYGVLNKYVEHCASGMAIDIFSTTVECFPNYLFTRTGGAEMNRMVAIQAKKLGWKWCNYGDGFVRMENGLVVERFEVNCERDIFEFLGIPYLKPEQRP